MIDGELGQFTPDEAVLADSLNSPAHSVGAGLIPAGLSARNAQRPTSICLGAVQLFQLTEGEFGRRAAECSLVKSYGYLGRESWRRHWLPSCRKLDSDRRRRGAAALIAAAQSEQQ